MPKKGNNRQIWAIQLKKTNNFLIHYFQGYCQPLKTHQESQHFDFELLFLCNTLNKNTILHSQIQIPKISGIVLMLET
jgi:hypothetical protein